MAAVATGGEIQAELLKAVAHPVRLRILAELAREEECVCHLSALLEKPQPYVSQGLAALKGAAMINEVAVVMLFGKPPGLVVDGRAVSYGRIPSRQEIATWLGAWPLHGRGPFPRPTPPRHGQVGDGSAMGMASYAPRAGPTHLVLMAEQMPLRISARRGRHPTSVTEPRRGELC